MLVLLAAVLASCTVSAGDGRAPGDGRTAGPRPAFHAGASGLGDRYHPQAGNGGYDVRHYHLDLSYVPRTGRLTGLARVTATATEPLSSFHLDLRDLRVDRVSVDGEPADTRRDGQELIITPTSGLPRGSTFQVRVRYSGKPGPVQAEGSALGTYGWVRTDDGAFVTGEPNGAPTWFPANDHPSDKATYSFEVSVPEGVVVAANGRLVDRRTRGGTTTYHWRTREPMATYLATATLGDFRIRRGRTPGGVPMISAVAPAQAGAADRMLETTARATDFFADLFGDYPFATTGAVIDDVDLGYALETQTRPVYPGRVSDLTIAHEIAHQWFGNSVTPRRWRDIWLNEGFAVYASWLWDHDRGGPAPAERFERVYREPGDSTFWSLPPGDPGASSMFGRPVYDRGAMTLHALRVRVGDDAFFEILRSWADEHAHGTATTEDFVAMAERVAGTELGPLFRAWLYRDAKPTHPGKSPEGTASGSLDTVRVPDTGDGEL